MGKETLGTWLSTEEKQTWSALARSYGMSVSAFTHWLIAEKIREFQKNKPEFFITNEDESEKVPLKILLFKSEYQALQTTAENLLLTKQLVMIAALREFLLSTAQIGETDRQILVQSTQQLNKIGVNLNQIARVLNAQAKADNVQRAEVTEALKRISTADMRIEEHLKKVDSFFELHNRRKKIKMTVKQGG